MQLLHPTFVRPAPSPPQSAANPWALHGILTESYLDAARSQMATGTVDPGTQMALGLLFFSTLRLFVRVPLILIGSTRTDPLAISLTLIDVAGNGQHERSADCWGAALSVTPDVSSWMAFVRFCTLNSKTDVLFLRIGLSSLESVVSRLKLPRRRTCF